MKKKKVSKMPRLSPLARARKALDEIYNHSQEGRYLVTYFYGLNHSGELAVGKSAKKVKP